MAQIPPDSSEAGHISNSTSLSGGDATGIFPLSFGQESLWLHDQIAPGSPAYNIPEAWRFRGHLDGNALQMALRQIVDRHESLRTVFESRDGKPVQKILARQPLAFTAIDFHGAADPESELWKWLRSEAARPFDLGRGPLFRAGLARLSETDYVLILNLHHIISDAWSLNILLRDLAEIYSSLVAAKTPALPELPIQFADFAVWQREALEAGALKAHLDYWRAHLGDTHEPLSLRTDLPRPPILSGRGATHFYTLPRELTGHLHSISKAHNSSLFLTLFAAFNALLARYTLREDILVGIPMAGRERIETEDLIGFFVNTLALRTDLHGDPPFVKLLASVKENLMNASPHQEMPVEKLVEALSLDRSLNQHSLFRVVFGWQTGTPNEWCLPGLASERIELDSGTSKFDWTLLVTETGQGLRIRFEYSTELFSAGTIDRVMEQFELMLHSIVADPQAPISRLSMMSPAERNKVLVEWNQTRTDYAVQPSIHRTFEAAAARSPQAIALRFGDENLTYQEVNQRSNQLARRLSRAGIEPGTRVGLAVDRSVELVIGLLAIVKAGAAYVPLDRTYPQERLKLMLEDAGVTFLVHGKNFACEGLPVAPERFFCMEDEEAGLTLEASENLEIEGSLESEAYICFTSGSTGTPKGAIIPHRGVLRLVKNTNYASFNSEDVFLQLASISFDASTMEIWGALLNDGKLVIFPPHAPSLEELARTIQNEKITVLWLTAGLFHQMSEGHLAGLAGLRLLLAGGEALSVPAVLQAARQLPNTELINGYGPTENTTFTCCFKVPRDWQGGTSVPIGPPISNTRVYILDPARQPLPIGLPGELHIAGEGLALGYAGKSSLTREKFVESPFSEIEAGKLYRTGDLARWRNDGSIEFLGRLDDQLKIRGFRVEPGEVESSLLQHGEVEQALIVPLADQSGTKHLAAYFVPRAGGTLSAEDLRQFLSAKLPAYMIPSWFIPMDVFPLTKNGKINRAALPPPRANSTSRNRRTELPHNPIEKKLHEIWSELLEVADLSVEDNFFHLGGHSLLATQVISRVIRELGVELQVRAIFESPTISGLAVRVQETMALHPVGSAPTMTPLINRSRAEDLLSRLDELSDAEVEHLLSDPELKQVLT